MRVTSGLFPLKSVLLDVMDLCPESLVIHDVCIAWAADCAAFTARRWLLHGRTCPEGIS